jgi:tetratricopeptide (TPR) repeat protein
LRRLFILILLFISFGLNAQNVRSYIKAAEQYILNGYYEEAINQYAKAAILEPQNGEIYECRAKAYEKTGSPLAAAEDYKSAAVFNTNPGENFLNSAKIYYSLKLPDEALILVSKAIEKKTRFDEAYLLKCQIDLELKKYEDALLDADLAIDAKNTAYGQYLKGKTEYMLNRYSQAEQDLEKAIIKDKALYDAFLTLAEVQYENDKIQYGIDNCSYVIGNEPKNVRALVLRSKGYSLIKQYVNAIQDISVAISLDSSNIEYFIYRGNYYLSFFQYQNAINDFTIVLTNDMLNYEAILQRARAYEMIRDFGKASSDYSLILSLTDKSDFEAVAYIQEKIFELNREIEKPDIVLIDPALNEENEVPVPNDLNSIEFVFRVDEISKLKFVKINNDTLINSSDGIKKKEFNHIIKAGDLEFLSITATDIYDNTSSVSYAVERIETHPPRIVLFNPYADDDGTISLTQDDNYLYLEGRIEDESLISSIHVDEVNASFAPRDPNPRFTATLDIRNKNRISVQAVDLYGNTVENEYVFRRDGMLPAEESPMGKTWVILVENSEYRDFSNLTSPSKDIQLMQQALTHYKINKVIVKKNLTKREMERFFSIDLRDLVRINQVNSLLIWFAGHGLNQNGTGYWIPADAKREVEFSYYNINALKASLYSYTSLSHILIVSDACETGPGFCIALRGPIESVGCTKTQLAQKKSAQVFTSSGEGYAYDNSLFTRSFANALLNNEDDCVSIEDIANRVSLIVQTSSVQKPEFGRISGIPDELGTFIFITR